MRDPVKIYVTRNVIHTGVALYQICASAHHVNNTAAGNMKTFLTLSTRLVTLSVQETTVMTRQSLSSLGQVLLL